MLTDRQHALSRRRRNTLITVSLWGMSGSSRVVQLAGAPAVGDRINVDGSEVVVTQRIWMASDGNLTCFVRPAGS